MEYFKLNKINKLCGMIRKGFETTLSRMIGL